MIAITIDWTRWDSDPFWSGSTYWDSRPPWVRPVRPGTIRWALKRSVDPGAEPITLDLAKKHLRVDFPDDDDLISGYNSAAREYIELRTGVAMMPSTWQLVLDRWPRNSTIEYWPWAGIPWGAIMLPRSPVTAISSIVWTGTDGSVNTVDPATYSTNLTADPAQILPVYGKYWPSQSLANQAGVTVTFTAGYTTAAKVPPSLKQALLLTLGHWYENRESVIIDTRVVAIDLPQAAQTLISMWMDTQVG